MSDTPTLTALVAYQQEVVFGYQVTLAKAPLSPSDRSTLNQFADDAAQAAGLLGSALTDSGGKVPAAPDPGLAPPPTDASRRGYLNDLITAEEAAVARLYTALGELDDARHQQGSAAFMAQAGRRLVALRQLAGRQLLPRTFETGGA